MRLRPLVTGGMFAAALAAGVALAPPAGAHEGDGIITMEASHPAGTSVHFIVRVTWENDGHPATDATVTATAVSSDGTELTPVALAPIDDDGRYANSVNFDAPGSWTVRFTSIDPTGTAQVTQEVEAAPATAGDGDTTTSSDGGDEGGFASADDGTGASGEAAAGDEDGGMPVWVIAAAAVVVVGGGLMALRTVRRYRPDGGPEPGTKAGA
ncbi:MAG TPA: hypothetical protein VE623_10205 [Acidimicrobiales bacterium]|jgi:hypothetical protein|nr:hypothetical protein [Acidimicrobiales bacterium]